MKATTQLLIVLTALFVTNCATYSGNGYKATIVGTNHKKYRQSANELSFDESNQSLVANRALNVVGTGITAAIAAWPLVNASNNAAAVDLGAQGVTKAKNAGKTAVDLSKVQP